MGITAYSTSTIFTFKIPSRGNKFGRKKNLCERMNTKISILGVMFNYKIIKFITSVKIHRILIDKINTLYVPTLTLISVLDIGIL